MKFGIFEHLDSDGLPPHEQFEERLQFIAACDRAGFYGYHLAEHHFSSLSNVPSPGIFLSAVAQRTQNIKLGPLVYLLPFYHPLRLIEEIAMLDQLSNGRFQLGVGRGISPLEMGYYQIDPAGAQQKYMETLEIVRRGLGSDVLNFDGEFFQYNNVPMAVSPVQRPHPPLWYGIGKPDSTVWAAANDVNVVTLVPAPSARAITDRYKQEWTALNKDLNSLPLLGLGRHIVIADTDEEAMDIARRAYRVWRRSFVSLWEQHRQTELAYRAAPPEFDDMVERGNACAGSAATVRDFVAEEIETAGVNYLLMHMTFGDISLPEALTSLKYFIDKIMPEFTA